MSSVFTGYLCSTVAPQMFDETITPEVFGKKERVSSDSLNVSATKKELTAQQNGRKMLFDLLETGSVEFYFLFDLRMCVIQYHLNMRIASVR